ncbi:hypothetical protein RHECNPAF_50006 [Rhizobium etli CNPAF512]|nr:hypothetical protein RHECNPAF_50006 [Rhizobium etli CNPAF512]
MLSVRLTPVTARILEIVGNRGRSQGMGKAGVCSEPCRHLQEAERRVAGNAGGCPVGREGAFCWPRWTHGCTAPVQSFQASGRTPSKFDGFACERRKPRLSAGRQVVHHMHHRAPLFVTPKSPVPWHMKGIRHSDLGSAEPISVLGDRIAQREIIVR